MDAYATYDELVLGWPDGAAIPSEPRGTELLARASRMVRRELSQAGITEPDQDLLAVCKDVVCEMVARACPPDVSSQIGATQGSLTVGPFSRSATFSSPVGDLYVSKAERRALGLSRVRVGSARAESAVTAHV